MQKKMGRKKRPETEKRAYVGMEAGLAEASRNLIRWNGRVTHTTKILVEKIVNKITTAMKRQSPAFARLHVKNFGAGSSYEGLKVGEPGEFDIDFLFKLPEATTPILKEDTIPGFVQLQLRTFGNLALQSTELHRVMRRFVDSQNYLLTSEMKSSFIESVFDKTVNNYFQGGAVNIGSKRFQISRVQKLGPALTLTIKGAEFDLSIDLVPCILLTENFWPKGGFRSNPYTKPSEFFIVPKQPKRDHPHIDRYWRLSFQMQERKIIFNRFWMKPAIRALKCMRDHFGHNVSSYAIKTVFMRELERLNPALDQYTPELWSQNPLSFCIVYMLEKYVQCLEEHKISYFWNQKLNLLDNLTDQQIEHYRGSVARMLEDIKSNPTPETVLTYLRKPN